MDLIDLHTHTNASDGADSPSETVRKASQAGLKAIAVTDHDTVLGLTEASAEGRELGLEVIRGCELSARSQYGEVHILGLWLPEDTTNLDSVLEELREHRNNRNQIIVSKLNALGLEVKYDELLEIAQGESVGRPHLASLLVNKGYVPDVKAAFDRYLGSKGKAYEPKKTLEPEQAVSLLSGLGATVGLAHPKMIRCPDSWLEELIEKLKEYGLDAIEAYHSEHSSADERACVELADKYDLALTGGSDYHGKTKPDIALGRGYGGLRVPYALLEKLKARRAAQNLPV